MQREHTRFGTESKEQTAACGIQKSTVFHRRAAFPQGDKGKIAGEMIQKEHAHQRHKSADDADAQKAFRSFDGTVGLFLYHPDVGGEGHHLKEHEGGVQIVRQKHAHGRAEDEEEKQIVAVAVFGVGKIPSRGHCRHKPRGGCQHRHHGTKAVRPKTETQPADIRQNQRQLAGKDQGQRTQKLQRGKPQHQMIPEGFAVPSGQVA